MSEGTKTLRLSKVAKEFNLSLGKIVEFLGAKGHPTDNNPNAKIGDEEYKLLLKEFSSDKSAREEAETVAQNNSKLKRETIVLDEIKPKKQRDEDFDEVVIKDLTIGKKPVIEKQEQKSEPVIKSEPPAVEKPEEKSGGPKVLGKLDLDAMNLRTKPEKRGRKEKEEEKPEPEKPAPVAEVPKTTPPPVEEKEEPKEEFLQTRYEKLEGPKILGKVVLPQAKEPSKKTGAGADASAADKKKRKRIRKGGLVS